MATTNPSYLYERSSCLPSWVFIHLSNLDHHVTAILIIYMGYQDLIMFIHLSLSLHSGALSDHLISSTATSTQEYIYEMERLWNQPQSSSKKIKTFWPPFCEPWPCPLPPPSFPCVGKFCKDFHIEETAFMNKTIIHGTLSIQHLFKAKHTDLNFFNSFLSLFSRLFLEASCLFPFSDKKTNVSWICMGLRIYL